MRQKGDSVEAALIQQFKEARRERLYKAYEEAAADAQYVAEMSELDREGDAFV
jgi:hypothetical protein